MSCSLSSSTKRHSIFKNDLFKQKSSQKFKTIPYHFNFRPTIQCVFDHSDQTIKTQSSNVRKSRLSSSKNKIFDQKRSQSEQKSHLSSIEQTNRCFSLCGEKHRNHTIFADKRSRMSQKDQSFTKEPKQQAVNIKFLKTQSQPEKNLLSKINQEKERFYRQQLEKKLREREKQRTTTLKEIQRVQFQVQPNIDIMKPQQYARMIKQVRLAAKSKRNHIIYPIPQILSQVPNNKNIQPPPQKIQKERLVYRI